MRRENHGSGMARVWAFPASHWLRFQWPQPSLTCQLPCLAEHPTLPPPLASSCLISPADSALEDSDVCLAPLEGRQRQWNGQQFQSRHNFWLKPNMTDLPLGRLFHLLFNACNKYLHDPALEGTLCDNSLHFPAKQHRDRIPKLQQRIFYTTLRSQVMALW